jgi:tetratricopeptide (TPR) repeat protein
MTVTTDAPSETEVREALREMLASPAFGGSQQLASFLTFIVEEALAGRASEIKGYTIATRALGRPESFDPQTDPIVRVQAGRLRQAMAEYHAGDHRHEVVISLERGGYVPRFERVATKAPSARMTSGDEAATVGPLVAEPDRATPTNRWSWRLALGAAAVAAVLIGALALSSGLGFLREPDPDFTPSIVVEGEQESGLPAQLAILNRMRDALARFDDIVVVREGGSGASAVRGSAPRLVLRIVQDAQSGREPRILARLIDLRDQKVLWSRAFEPAIANAGAEDRETTIIRAIAATLAQPYGVIHAHVRSLSANGDRRSGPYGCLVAGFDYWHVNDAASHANVRRCLLEKALEHPSAAAIHAQLAFIHLEEYRQGYNPLPGDPRERALASANAAVRHAPASARAQQALLAAHFARGDMDAAWRAAGEALRLNPYDTEILQDVGARHVQSGHFEKGLAMIDEALALNPSPPTWALTFRAVALYMLGRLDQSGPAALRLRETSYPPAKIALVMASYQFRDLSEGRRWLDELERVQPVIASDVGAYLDRLNFAPVIRDQVVKDFAAAANWLRKGM